MHVEVSGIKYCLRFWFALTAIVRCVHKGMELQFESSPKSGKNTSDSLPTFVYALQVGLLPSNVARRGFCWMSFFCDMQVTANFVTSHMQDEDKEKIHDPSPQK